ncbi:MAG TPA: MaoC family dehydratase N-terminal domain-containing protein [Acidimicrobiales bacterium]|nr:MaoC family dehydratase N-terminal domain-containing protein [Acidimicrobiales bacterium]
MSLGKVTYGPKLDARFWRAFSSPAARAQGKSQGVQMAISTDRIEFDTSDVDRYIGQPVGGGQLKEPVAVNDIRRWVQGMQYPNPLHFDEDYAAGTSFGRIVAPQSFTICCDVGHGAGPAIVGNIPGTHMIFGGDEWWFGGPRIYSGDLLRMTRRFVDYKVSDTKFAGPTMFSRGETVYRNQRGEQVARQWSTAVRYRADIAREKGFFEKEAPRPVWSAADLADIETRRREWIRSYAKDKGPSVETLEIGARLPTRPIGPHSVASFASEWRSYTFTVWGSSYHEGPDHLTEAGWLDEMDRDLEGAKEDPELGDGLYHGPSRGHTDEEHAQLIGMPRGYGYGASMGAWVLDYIAAWAGDLSFVRHSNVQYRFPAFEGDLTLLDGEVIDLRNDPTLGTALVTVDVKMTNQSGVLMARGPVEVELPG